MCWSHKYYGSYNRTNFTSSQRSASLRERWWITWEWLSGGGEMRMEEKKVEAIREWTAPSQKKDLQHFLGFINFYCKFIKDFSMIAHLLHELTGNNPWEWLPCHQTAFDTLKNAISDSTILHTLHDTGKFKVEADSSDFTVDGTLCLNYREDTGSLSPSCWNPSH